MSIVATFDFFRKATAVVVDNLHTTSNGTACDRLSDVAHTDDTEGFAIDGDAEIVHHAKFDIGIRLAHTAVEFGSAVADGEHECEGMLGSRFDDRTRGVGNRDTTVASCSDVDIVEAYAEVGDKLEVRRSSNHFGCDFVVESR